MNLFDHIKTGLFSLHPTALSEALNGFFVSSEPVKPFLMGAASEAIPINITNVYEWISSLEDRLTAFKAIEGEDAIPKPAFPFTFWQWKKDAIETIGVLSLELADGSLSCFLFCQTSAGIEWTHSWCIESVNDGLRLKIPMSESAKSFEETKAYLVWPTLVINVAQSIMHCKNVQTEVQSIPPKLARKTQRKKGYTPTAYRKIVIDPMKAAVKRSADSTPGEPMTVRRALSVVRGHFRTYTPERKLFGRVHGRFFIPSFTKGDIDHGTVKKDYVVKGPKTAA